MGRTLDASVGLTRQDNLVKQGKAFSTASVKQTLAAAGNVNATFENPTGSGKTITIYAFRISSSAAGFGYANIYLTPTTNLPSTAVTPRNQSIGGAASSALVKVDNSLTNALSGGTLIGNIAIVPSVITRYVDQQMILPANSLIGLNMVFAGAGDFVFKIWFYEE